MKLFKSLLLGASLTNFFVSAFPFSDRSSESDIAEREDTQLLARSNVCTPPFRIAFCIFVTEPKFILIKNLFVAHGSYNKRKAVEFVKNIPLESLAGFGTSGATIHSVDKNGRVAKGNFRPADGVSDSTTLFLCHTHLIYCSVSSGSITKG